MTRDPRPKRYPPPEFPPQRVALFAKTPPAIFPPILGLLGLTIALRLARSRLEWDTDVSEFVAGMAVALWVFGAVAYLAKVARRPGVVLEDLRVLPGRSGLAALTMGGMAAASLIAIYSQPVAAALLLVSLAGHAVLAGLLVRLLLSLPPEARVVNPTLHLSFVGFIVGAPAALALGWGGLAKALFWTTLPVALAIWGLSLRQFVGGAVPPAPLRPLLAIHLAPAALFAIVAVGTGQDASALAFLGLAAAILLALGLASRCVLASGFSPLWGAFTFPLAAAATAFLLREGTLAWVGLALLGAALIVVPTIAWKVLRLWPGGKLAAKTNAAKA